MREMFIRSFKMLFIFSVLILLTACSTKQYVSDKDWPADMPAKSIFLEAFDADPVNKAVQNQDEYLLWIVRFYKGWELYRRGWLKMTDELLEQLPNPDESVEVNQRIYDLGIKISTEWAKKSDSRVIYLRHVYVWGNALLESIERNDCLNLLKKIDQDINDLLARNIGRETITQERYYPVDPDNPFL